MSGKILFLSVSLVVLVFSGGFALADCPSADLTGDCFVDFEDFAVMAGHWLDVYDGYDLKSLASQWLTGEANGQPNEPNGMEWVYIDDPGVSGHEGFTGQMSRYETTNAQYCQFLNAALASGDVVVVVFEYFDGSFVCGANGSNSGGDCVGKIYFDTHSAQPSSQIEYSDGVFSVRTKDGHDMREHPVVEVSWYGATAFCDYYDYRLPTEDEWECAARGGLEDMAYPWGNTWDNSRGNCKNSGDDYESSAWPWTTPVDHYPGQNAYGLHDMAGNVMEWASSCYYSDCDPNNVVLRGGSWDYNADWCQTTFRMKSTRGARTHWGGFRVVLSD